MDSKDIASIIAPFLGKDAAALDPATAVDRSAVKSSIMLHRMYGQLAEAGYPVSDYMDIRTFGQLMERLNGNTGTGPTPEAVYESPAAATVQGAAGIDIEAISALPRTDDFREHAFYQQNFAASEIAWCILKPDPYASFAGLFAAKEALVKASAQFSNRPFNTIVVTHDASGKPVYPGFSLSIAHTDTTAVAVAIADQPALEKAVAAPAAPQTAGILALLLALAALGIAILGFIFR